eukprot:1801832-Prymnesium_polylepis.3
MNASPQLVHLSCRVWLNVLHLGHNLTAALLLPAMVSARAAAGVCTSRSSSARRAPRPTICIYSPGESVGRSRATKSTAGTLKPIESTVLLASARSSPARKASMALSRSALGVSPRMAAHDTPCRCNSLSTASVCSTPEQKRSHARRRSPARTISSTARDVCCPALHAAFSMSSLKSLPRRARL